MGICAVCGGGFEPRVRQGGRPKKYCGAKCSRVARDAKALEIRKAKRPVYERKCSKCFSAFTTKLPNQIYCSRVCRLDDVSSKAHLRWVANHPRPEQYEYECSRCEMKFYSVKHITGVAAQYGRFCDDCSLELKRIRYRRKGVTRRGYLSESRVSVEQLVSIHGSDCSLCGEDIDILLPRTSKWGATIDHRIPLSKGGSDELDNLQLAHWICNNRKGNKVTDA